MRKTVLVLLAVFLLFSFSLAKKNKKDHKCNKRQPMNFTSVKIKSDEGGQLTIRCFNHYNQRFAGKRSVQDNEFDDVDDLKLVIEAADGETYEGVVINPNSRAGEALIEDGRTEIGVSDYNSLDGITIQFYFKELIDINSAELFGAVADASVLEGGLRAELKKRFENVGPCKEKQRKKLGAERGDRNLSPVEVTVDLIQGDASQSDNRVDVVFIGDGFAKSDAASYNQEVQRVIDGFAKFSPFTEYLNFWNIWRVNAWSGESGVCDGLGRDKTKGRCSMNSAFNTYFWCANIERLPCPDTGKVWKALRSVLKDNQMDMVDLIINSKKYGGSGGAIATNSIVSSAKWIAIHEVGHSYAKLADEYTYGSCRTTTNTKSLHQKNVDVATNSAKPKWSHWMDGTAENRNVGAFKGGKYCPTTVIRPTDNSMMRSLAREFEQVNRELYILSFYKDVDTIDSFSPSNRDVNSQGPVTFSVKLVKPNPNTLSVKWFLNGKLEKEGVESLTLQSVPKGTLKVVVKDETKWVRHDPENLLVDEETWNLNSGSSGGSNGGNNGGNTGGNNGGNNGGSNGGNLGSCAADKNEHCSSWAKAGYCTKSYVAYMKVNCATTCCDKTANNKPQQDKCATLKDNTQYSKSCPSWANQYCDKSYVDFMKQNCKLSCCKKGHTW